MMTREQALREYEFLKTIEKDWGPLSFMCMMHVLGPTIMEIREALLQPAA